MHICDICEKETGNGVLVKVNGRKIKICASSLQWGGGELLTQAREIIRTHKKGNGNGVIADTDFLQRKLEEKWAAFWTPDCEDLKAKLKARKRTTKQGAKK